ncbi:MAG: hypothetical protein HRU28_11110, partial [Rhizobiales bacterium]|nr:hypothetical protein [Hyphomicrobiales bacterium]
MPKSIFRTYFLTLIVSFSLIFTSNLSAKEKPNTKWIKKQISTVTSQINDYTISSGRVIGKKIENNLVFEKIKSASKLHPYYFLARGQINADSFAFLKFGGIFLESVVSGRDNIFVLGFSPVGQEIRLQQTIDHLRKSKIQLYQILPSDRISPNFRKNIDVKKIVIVAFRGTDHNLILNQLSKFGKVRALSTEGYFELHYKVDLNRTVTFLSKLNWIENISALPKRVEVGDTFSRSLTGVDIVQNVGIPPQGIINYSNGLSGKDITVTISEPIKAIPDFKRFDGSVLVHDALHPSYIQTTGGLHGTVVAGVIVGQGRFSEELGTAPFEYRGVAPDAKI